MASNTTIADEAGEFDDWIELYNGGGTAINLNGYFLSDDILNPMAVQLDTSVIIQPGGFVLLWADKDPEQGKLHLDFKLGAAGEQISLMSPSGVFVDSLTYTQQLDNISSGRFPDGSTNFFLYDDPTPGVTNASSGSIGKAENPVFSIQGGFYSNSVSIELVSTTPGAMIYYTLDGEDPDESSTLYTGDIQIDASTIVRARAYANNYLPSDIKSHSYIVDETYTLPVLSIVTDPDNMFGQDGIYTNPEEEGQDWERPCQVQYFKNENLDFSIDCGIRIQGSSSVNLPKKSFRLFFDDDYGQSRLEYPMFEGSNVTDFKNLVLRAGYDDDITDDSGTLLKDPYGNRQYKESGGLITEGNWAILTINGEYWGVYEIRESLNKEFIESHTGWNDFDLVRFNKFEPELKNGTWTDWDYMRDFLENNDMSDESNYAVAAGLIDIDNLVNVQALIQCSVYRSWSYGISTYKENTPGGKWQYTVWDMDRSHGGPWWNPHDDYSENEPLTWGNFLNESLTKNETFRNKLVNRVADILNTNYKPANAIPYLDAMRLEIDAEMGGEYDRWNPSEDINTWYDNLAEFNLTLEERPDVLRGYIVDYYNFSGSNTINIDKTGEGKVMINTVDVPGFPWSGIYFEDVPVPISAVPAPGYSFNGWSDPSLPNDPNIEIVWDGTYDLTAYFVQGSTTVADVVINEINYNSPATIDAGDWIELYNSSGAAVDISAWYFKDEGGSYFNIPPGTIIPADGYLVLAEDSIRFQGVNPTVTNFIGAFGDSQFGSFKLSNSGEHISISNANGSYIDTVRYNDVLPWPIDADGNGPSLQLIDATLDNALASSWQAVVPTPGVVNNTQGSQAINFPAISDKFTIDLPFQITATASSGLPVSFSIISGPATISGNTVTLNGVAGTVIVQADQAGNQDYDPAQSVQQTFEVVLQSQTINFASIPDKLTTDLPFGITANASSGLSVSFSIISGPASVSGNTITLDGIGGTVVVQADQLGNDDYLPAMSVQQIFEVNLQSQTIDFSTIPDKFTTDVPFTIAANASSNLPVSFSIVSGPASVTGNTITLDGIGGTVVVQADQLGNDNYLPAMSVQQTFEVNLQSQTINFDAIPDKFTTDSPFEITANASSSLPVSFSIISGPASVTGNTITLDGIGGTVVVQADQLGNDNYLPAMSVQQTFEVNLQSQTINFDAIPDKFTTDSPFEITANASSSLPVSFSIISGPASILGNTITLDGVSGTVIVQADQSGNGDFLAAASVQQIFEVNLQSQTIDFPIIPNKLTTDLPFVISATSSAGLPVSFSILSGPASISGTTITLNGTVGTVVVQANQPGNGDYLPAISTRSFVVTVEILLDQTISFNAIPDKITTDVPFEIMASASSGLSVSYSIVSGPASVSGNTITLDGIGGTVIVQADQAGDVDYYPAQPVQQSFEVNLQSQTIDFPAISDKITTDLPFDIMAVASSGLAVDFEIVSGPASVLGSTITLDGVQGMVVVRASQPGNATYAAAADAEQSFEVNIQSQTIDFPSISDKITTDVPFEIMASASSGLAVSFEIVSGPASVSGSTITLDGIEGTVVVRAIQAGDATYGAVDIEQSFEVNLTNQTIDFSAILDKLTTDVPFEIMASASSGLTVSFEIVSGPASVSGSTITLDGVQGTVVVRASQPGNVTYAAATDAEQSFEVNIQSQTIDFPSISDKITTDVPFEITAVASSGLAVSFEIVSGPASVSGSTITLNGIEGTVVVRASQAGDATYGAVDIEQSFEVNLTNQTIDFSAISDKITTDVPFEIMASASSGLAVSFEIVSGPANVLGNTITLDGIQGAVVVRASQSGDATYAAAVSVEQSFEVNMVDAVGDLKDVSPVIEVYPNPVSVILFLKINEGIDSSYDLLLHDNLGRLLQKKRINDFSSPEQMIKVDFLIDGMYTLTILQNNKVYVTRFIKSR